MFETRRLCHIPWAGLALLVFVAPVAAQEVQFNRDIRPILSNHCYQCHGPDGNQRQGDFRLDEEQPAKASGNLSPGKPEESELLRRLTTDDPDERMPPSKTGKQLSEQQIALLRAWIKGGARWQQHWSLQPPQPQTPPAIQDDSQAANAIDRFLLHRLAQQNLSFSKRADRRTLIRRLYLDVIGLPPTPDQVDSFVSDENDDAYEKLVDQLLASPQYGERMAVYWLDLVRYADTNGIHGDNHREHWLYRDYVINAFNNNMPFDQFTREQLAGDLLENPTRMQRIASGYNRLNMTTREGGAQAKEYRAKYAADRVRNASTVWMGATLGCAECHDHKFDPYTTKDFYQFAAFFADIQETAVGTQQPAKLPTLEQEATIKKLDSEIAQLKKQLESPDEKLQTALAESLARWESEWKDEPIWAVGAIESARGIKGSGLQLQEDNTIAKADLKTAKDQEHFELKLKGEWKGLTGVKVEALNDDAFPAKGPGLAANGNFVINEIRVTANGQPVKLGKATAQHSQNDWPAERAADGKGNTGWAILPQTGKPHAIVVPFAAPLDESNELAIVIECNYGTKHMPGKLRISTTTAAAPAAGSQGLPGNIVKVLRTKAADRTDSQQAELAKWHRSIAPELNPIRKKLADTENQKKKTAAAAPAILIATAGTPRMTRVLPRGNWLDESGEEVMPQAPSFLPQIGETKQERLSRLDLAGWMTNPNNPFVSRVFVNRLWKLAFGHGIVRSLDDFGAQGSWPSHPALLDYLAVDFRQHWDVKRTFKMILMSNAYQQSSAESSELRERDPFNSLYARQSRFRLDAELIRDNALQVSGLLVNKLGGPSAKPYQPSGYWSHLNFPRRSYKHDTNENQYRRGLYTYWCRTFLHPSLQAFDATTREECTVERPRSNTPLAALALLNDPTYVEAARVLAESAVSEHDAPGKRLQFIFRRVLQRQPRPAEAALLLPLAEQHRKQFANDADGAKKILATGLKPYDEKAPVEDLAAWTSIARVVLNLHETINRN